MSTITPSTAVTVPAGWYPDPAGSGKLRLWSGNSWTSQLEVQGPHAQPEYRFLSDGVIVQQYDY